MDEQSPKKKYHKVRVDDSFREETGEIEISESSQGRESSYNERGDTDLPVSH